MQGTAKWKWKKKNQGFLEDFIKEIPQLNDCLICIFFFETNVLVFMPLKKFLKSSSQLEEFLISIELEPWRGPLLLWD